MTAKVERSESGDDFGWFTAAADANVVFGRASELNMDCFVVWRVEFGNSEATLIVSAVAIILDCADSVVFRNMPDILYKSLGNDVSSQRRQPLTKKFFRMQNSLHTLS